MILRLTWMRNLCSAFLIFAHVQFVLASEAQEEASSLDRRYGQLLVQLDFSKTLDLQKLFGVTDLRVLKLAIKFAGRRHTQTVSFEDDHKLELSLPENVYSFELSRVQTNPVALYSGRVPVKRSSQTRMTIYLQSKDHRSGENIPYGYHSLEGSIFQGARREVYGDYTKNFRADGVFEYYQFGQVFRRDSDQESSLYFDQDLDGKVDELDPDDDDDGIRDEIDKDDDNDGILDEQDFQDTDNDNDGLGNGAEIKDLILGNLQHPVLESFQVHNLTHPDLGLYGQAGDLLKVLAKTDSAGGSGVESVVVRIYRNGKELLKFPLYDDGSEIDRNIRMQGAQISGDAKVADGEFANILPLDLALFEYLYNCFWIVKAANEKGKVSAETIFIAGQALDQFLPEGRSDILQKIENVDLVYAQDPEEGSGVVKLSLKLAEKLSVRLYSGGHSYYLNGQKNPLNFYDYSDSLTVRPNALMFLTIQDGSGGVFYFGHKL